MLTGPWIPNRTGTSRTGHPMPGRIRGQRRPPTITAPCQPRSPLGASTIRRHRDPQRADPTDRAAQRHHLSLPFRRLQKRGRSAAAPIHAFRPTAPTQNRRVSSSHLTATSAELEATLDPHGLPTSYTFEYGPSTAYGQTLGGEILGSPRNSPKLDRSWPPRWPPVRRAYRFRLLAQKAEATADTLSEDQTFEFFPPSCPNSVVRQQTGAVYLPDCRG